MKTIIKLLLRTNWDWKSPKWAAANSAGTLHNELDGPSPASMQVLHYHTHQSFHYCSDHLILLETLTALLTFYTVLHVSAVEW